MTKPKVLLVTPAFPSFVRQDILLLLERYELIVNTYHWTKKANAPIYLLAQFFHILFNIQKVNFILVHFGGYWSFFPSLFGRIFGKPVYIVLHGTDTAAIPTLNYGSLRIPLLKWFCKKSYQWATMLLPVSESLAYTENSFLKKNENIQNGFLYHFPQLRTPYQVIPNGFDFEFWNFNAAHDKELGSFLAVLSASQYILKGGDLIVELAKRMDSCTFYIAGMDKPEGLDSSKNVRFLGHVSADTLKNYYQKVSFYFQLSAFEGFGCALCEAMLCGCIPIVSQVNSLPEIVGDYGLLLPHRDINLLEKLVLGRINEAVTQEEKQAIRVRIIEKYSKQNRKVLLFGILPYPI